LVLGSIGHILRTQCFKGCLLTSSLGYYAPLGSSPSSRSIARRAPLRPSCVSPSLCHFTAIASGPRRHGAPYSRFILPLCFFFLIKDRVCVILPFRRRCIVDAPEVEVVTTPSQAAVPTYIIGPLPLVSPPPCY